MKIFRRLQPGENPEVEIGRFLCEEARFSHIPPYFGEVAMIRPSGEKSTVALLQGLVANEGDGWQWFLSQLENFFQSVHDLPEQLRSQVSIAPAEHDAGSEFQPFAAESLQAAALLGRRTAELHLALATSSDNPAFAAESFKPEDLARDTRRIDAQLASTFDALKAKLATLKDPVADEAALLLSRRRELIAHAHAITEIPAAGRRIRIHGDYHLGQTLRVSGAAAGAGDFVIIDFEGEPARPLAERRQKQSPLKDVAGMIRSLSYAASTGLDLYLDAKPDLAQGPETELLQAWATAWRNAASLQFLQAYRETISAEPSLLPGPAESQTLLTAYILEKALYELLYELNNRPGWLRIPLSGILNL